MRQLLYTFLFTWLISFSLHSQPIDQLLETLQPSPATCDQISKALEMAAALEEFDHDQISNELERMLQNALDMPLLRRGGYLTYHSQLVVSAAKVLHQRRKAPLHAYPRAKKHANVHFIYDLDTGAQLAVFKADGPRHRERMTWELSCLFGIDSVFVPAMQLTIDGVVGELQTFCRSDLSTEQCYKKSVYPLVTMDSYLKCALGTLLFALYDMHNENCYFQLLSEGYIQLGFWDSFMAFDRLQFEPKNINGLQPSLETPFAWLGWDFPQYQRPLSKRFRGLVGQIVTSWPEAMNQMDIYLHSPANYGLVKEEHIQEMHARAVLLREVIQTNPRGPVSSWHQTICPKYTAAAQAVESFFPGKQAMYVLFRLSWYPSISYEWIEPGRTEAFKLWLRNFVSTSPV